MNTAVDDSVVQTDAEARIVDALLARGRLKEADLLRARQLQREAGGGLLSLLARLGLVSERDHAETSAQVLGQAPYLDDMPEVRGTLYAAPILSPVAHGTLHGVDTRAALAMPGVRGVVLAAISQCAQGHVQFGVYAAGSRLAEVGLVSCGGMTREAALGKLFALLGAGLTQAEVEHWLARDLCGEMSD